METAYNQTSLEISLGLGLCPCFAIKNGKLRKVCSEQAMTSSTLQEKVFAYIKGKVHGSLARAGKVKGQTPKVEKMEKKKKVTGFVVY